MVLSADVAGPEMGEGWCGHTYIYIHVQIYSADARAWRYVSVCIPKSRPTTYA